MSESTNGCGAVEIVAELVWLVHLCEWRWLLPTPTSSGTGSMGDTRGSRSEMQAYEEMPIEDFGKAYLRGGGWEEGGAVGVHGSQIGGCRRRVSTGTRPQIDWSGRRHA